MKMSCIWTLRIKLHCCCMLQIKQRLMLQFLLALCLLQMVNTEILSAALNNYATNNFAVKTCGIQQNKYLSLVQSIDDVEDLELDVPVHIALDNRQRKRFLLQLNFTTPLMLTFSENVAHKIYYNQTNYLLRPTSIEPHNQARNLLLHCALHGQYDIFLQARQRGSIKIEAHAGHPQETWVLLNRTHRVNIRSQNRVRKRQMIVKWERSKFDFHAMHYCLVVSTIAQNTNFCEAVAALYIRHKQKSSSSPCIQGSIMDIVWQRTPERAKRLDPQGINIVCTGNRTQQLLRGLIPNSSYYLDIFGVHQRRQNLTIHMVSTKVQFTRTHPTALSQNALALVKISGMHGVQVFGYKVPNRVTKAEGESFLRYLILPCGGSELNVKILRQRHIVGNVNGIYRPTYIKLASVHAGERYLMRFAPSNEDEKLRANKVGLAVTTGAVFQHLPELPENITVFEVRTRCRSTTIAWYSSPEMRDMSYCIIVFNLPQRNRSSIDYTNYCMDFGKRVMLHPHFYSKKCMEKFISEQPLQTDTIFNLSPGERYLIYVTANLSEGRPLPYQSLRIHMTKQCHTELYDVGDERTEYN